MPAYVNTAFKKPGFLVPGFIDYSWGGFATDVANTKMLITADSISSDVATLYVNVLEGNIPVVGQSISVKNSANSSGAFNGGPYTLTGVTINATTGVGTVTFALTASNQGKTADNGFAVGTPPTTYEALPGTATAGKQFAASGGFLTATGQRGITWFTQFTGAPSSVVADLQGADIDTDSAYTTIDQSVLTTGETRSVGNVNFLFYRIVVSGSGGTSPTVAAGMMVR
jgi:hypothetical protein